MTEIKTIIKTDDKDLIEFLRLDKMQTLVVKRMFKCMDENNIVGFRFYFDKWHEVTSDIVNNKYNTVGHSLTDDLLEYAYNNCFDLFDIYYERETL